MRFLIVILLTVTPVTLAVAQTQGNRPNPVDAFISDTVGSTAGQIAYPEPISAGDEIVVCINIDATQPVPTVTDSLGNTYTMTAGTTTPLPQNTKTVYMGYTNATFSGNDIISYAISTGTQSASVTRIKNVSGVLDGSVQTATYTGNGSGGSGSFSTSVTTGTNGSLLVTCGVNSGFGQNFLGPSNNTEYVAENQQAPGEVTFLGVTRTTSKGAYSPTINTYNDFAFGSHATFAAQTLALKPSPTIFIADTALPDSATNVAYSAQLHCYGGTAGQTYSVFSGTLPTGLSLNTSTGVISGTPTGTTQTVGFRCTDGTVTSATNSLILTVGAGFNTPTVRQGAACVGLCSFSSPVDCGDVIALLFYGIDTHNTSGWLFNSTGTNNKITDSLNTTFRRVDPIGGNLAAPYVLYVGQATQSGTDAISITINTTGSPLNWTAADIGNVQNVVDTGVFTSAGAPSSSPYTINSSYTTTVPNEMLLVGTNTGFNNSETATLFPLATQVTSNVGCCTNVSVLGWTSIASASTYSATSTITNTGSASQLAQSWGANLMQAFRPALPVAACGIFTGNHERIIRTIY